MSVTMIPGLSNHDTRWKLVVLLASSPSRSIPALIFTRPFSIVSDAELDYPELKKFHQLFRGVIDKSGTYGKPETFPSKNSVYDFQYGAIELGPGLEALRRQMHLNVTYQEKVTFLEISAQLRQQIWSIFATKPDEYREAQMTLSLLTMLSLPTPYTEPLWEMTSFFCKDLISSTLIPFLSKLSASTDFYPAFVTEERYCLLVFHLTNLGFVLDDIHWHLIFNKPKSSEFKSFFNIHQQMSHLLNVPNSEPHVQKLKDPGDFNLPQVSLYASLIGFTISKITWRSSVPDTWECYESWRSWWSANSPFRTTSLEDIADAIVYPEKPEWGNMINRVSPQLICALAVGLRCSGHLGTSSILLNSSLTFDSSERYSHVFGFLFAELVNLSVLLDQAQKALILAATYLKETGTNHSYVSIAKADAYIALGKYSEAHELLQRILSDRSTGSFEKICSVLRLNKAWRRDPNMLEHSRLINNLASVVNLIKRQNIQVQEEYMYELQATAYHVKQLEKSAPSDLHKLIEDTLELFKGNDVILQTQRSALQMLIEKNDLDVPTSGLAQVDQKPTATVRRKSYASIEETMDPAHVNQDQYTDVQLETSYERKSGGGRAYLDPFADSNTNTHFLFGPTSITDDTQTQEIVRAFREKNLLALDGNGTQIYWSLLVLQKLMELIKREEKKQALSAQHAWDAGLLSIQPAVHGSETLEGTVLLPCDYFDIICSASMGGFIALILGRYQRSIEECISLYKQMLQDTFSKQLSVLKLTQSLSSRSVDTVWDMTGAIARLKTLTDTEPLMITPPGRCSVFILASGRASDNFEDTRLYLIRSYSNSNPKIKDPWQLFIPINYGPASLLKTSQAMKAATAPFAFPSKITLERAYLEPEIICISDAGSVDATDLVSLGYRELETLYGTKGIGTIVSVGVRPRRELQSGRSFRNSKKGLEPWLKKRPAKVPQIDSYWRFCDERSIDLEPSEWKPNGITTRKHEMGSATLAKIQTAFDKWVLQPENEKSLLECARKLVARRRLRAANRERRNIYTSGESSINPFEDENNVVDTREAVSASRKSVESGSHYE